jgi:hypothetical protein
MAPGPGEGAEPREVVGSLNIPDDLEHRYRHAIACGERSGKLVFTLELSTETSRVPALLVVDPDSRKAVAFTKLDVEQLTMNLGQHGGDRGFPEHAPLRGALPRFVPIVEDVGHGDGGTFRLSLLDVDERRITRRGRIAPEMLHTLVHRHGDVFYVIVMSERGRDVVRIDGNTGEVTAAATISTEDGPQPFHVRDGLLWVHAQSWKDEVLTTALDARTLVPIAPGGVAVKPIPPAAAADSLGLGATR